MRLFRKVEETPSILHRETSKAVTSSSQSYRKQEIGINIEPQYFENELCEGKALVMLRPPNPSTPWLYSDWFRGKSRRMELQVQMRLKNNVSPQSMWISVSPTPLERVNLNLITSTCCKIILACISHFLGVAFKWSFGGGGEIPHMTLPADSMLSMLVTRPGQTPPRLGSDDMRLVPAKASDIREEWAKAMPFDANHTYTFTFYSKYLDIAQWAIVELPGICRLGLETFWPGASSINIILRDEQAAGGPKTYLHLQLGSFNACVLHHPGSTDFEGSGKISQMVESQRSFAPEKIHSREKQRSCCLVDFLSCLSIDDTEHESPQATVCSLGRDKIDTQSGTRLGKIAVEKVQPNPSVRWLQILCTILVVLFSVRIGMWTLRDVSLL